MKRTEIKQSEASFLELPYAKSPLFPGRVIREGGVGVDVRPFRDFALVQHVDNSPYSTGFITIYGETRYGAVRGQTLEDSLWAEVRVVVAVHEIQMIWFEGAVGHSLVLTDTGSGGPEKTPGPVYLPFMLGEVPDTIDVYARMRRGNPNITFGYDDDEILNVVSTSRFRV